MNVQRLALFLLGGFAGFMAGLTGIGGPVISVPFMISVEFPPLYSVAMAQPFQGSGVYVGKHRQYVERFHRLRHGSVGNRS